MHSVRQHKADPAHLRAPAPPLFVVLGRGDDAGQALDEHGPGDDKELTGCWAKPRMTCSICAH